MKLPAPLAAAVTAVRQILPGARPPRADQRLTVMRIIDRLNIGGPAIHAVVTSRGLDRTRFRTILVIGSIEASEGDMAYLLEGSGVDEVICIPALGRELRPLRDLKTSFQLMRLMLKERPDVVHTHKAKAGAIGRTAALFSRVPVRVHTFHGHVLSGYFGPLKSGFYRAVERILARASSALVVPSPRLADDLSHKFHVAARDRFEVVPLGFDLSPFKVAEALRGQLRAEIGVGPTTKLVGIVGRMVPIKDHATFIASADLLAKRRADVNFVFVGGGELQAAIRADVAQRGLTDRCHFLGWRRDLDRIYADLDVAALSSLNEGTPVSLIEAMSCGTPVVSTNVGGVADVLRGGARGKLSPVGDPVALADAIEASLLPAAKANAATFRAEVQREYGSDRLCRQLEELYDKLLARDPAGSPVRLGS